MLNIITVENDLRSRQFLDENFFQIAARCIISLDKRIAFSKKSYGVSGEECTTTNMISVIRIYLLCLQTVLITAAPGVAISKASKQHVHGKFHFLSLESKYFET